MFMFEQTTPQSDGCLESLQVPRLGADRPVWPIGAETLGWVFKTHPL